MPKQLERNREFERQLTREIAGGLSLDVGPLIAHAERRADHFAEEYGHDFPDLTRDLVREATEEALDLRNYLVWELDAICRGLRDGGDRVVHLQQALRYLALLFEEVRRAQ